MLFLFLISGLRSQAAIQDGPTAPEPALPAQPAPSLPVIPPAPPDYATPADVPASSGSGGAAPFLNPAPTFRRPRPAFPSDGLPALPELSTGPDAGAPTDSGAALAGASVSTTNSEIGAAQKKYLYSFQFGSRATFDDNIFLNSTNKVSDEFLTLNAAIILGLGDQKALGNYARFEYTPDASFYVSHSENDAVQHSVVLSGLYQFTKLTVSAQAAVRILDGTDLTTTTAAGAQSTQANLDVSGRTRVNIYSGQTNFHYSFSEKTSADLGGQYSRSDYETLISSQSLSGSFFVNYTFSPKLTLGVGTTDGLIFSQPPNPDQAFVQANLRTTYELTGKISLAGTFGIELRSSDSSDEIQVGPVFELNAIYLPFDGTAASISANRRVTPSAVLGGQSFTLTDFSVSFRQRFFQRYFLSLTAGYQNSVYESDVSGVNANREDNYFYIQPALDFAVHERFNIGLALLHRQSESSSRSLGFNDNQVSISVSFTF